MNLANNDIGACDFVFCSVTGEEMLGLSFGALPNLTHLNLNSAISFASDTGVRTILQGLSSISTLTILDLGNNSIDGELMLYKLFQTHSKLLPTSTTRTSAEIRDDSGYGAVLAAGLANHPHLTYLNLSGNKFGSAQENGTIVLGKILPTLVSLQHFDISQNNIGNTGDAGTVALATGIRSLQNLTYMDTSGDLNQTGFPANTIGQSSDVGTVILGVSFGFLPNLTYINLGGNKIGSQGTNGTAAIGTGLQNNDVLTTLNLANNNLGAQGSAGVITLLKAVAREGLNLDITGAINIPWTTAAQALYTLNAGPIQEACEQQKCFGSTTPQNTNTTSTPMSSVGTRHVLSLEEVAFDADDSC